MDDDHPVRVLGIQVVQLVGVVLVEDLGADHPFDLGLGHRAVQGQGDRHLDILDAMLLEHVEEDLEDRLADVRAPHRRQRDADVVDGDRDLHARLEPGVQRRGIALGIVERVADRRPAVRDAFHRRFWIDRPRAGRKGLEHEVFPVVEHAGEGVLLEDAHVRRCRRRSAHRGYLSSSGSGVMNRELGAGRPRRASQSNSRTGHS